MNSRHIDGQKVCSRCAVPKPLNEFSKNKTLRDGLSAQCRKCQSDSYRIVRTKRIQQASAWYQENKEYRSKYNAEYREKNRDKLKKLHAELFQKNKHRWREVRQIAARRRRMRLNSGGGGHTIADIREIRRLQKDRCAMPDCRKRLNGRGHLDHRISIKNGGTDDKRNLQFLCANCNHRKSSMDELVFARKRGLLL